MPGTKERAAPFGPRGHVCQMSVPRGSASETPGELPGHRISKTRILKMLYCITEDMVLWLKALASPLEYSDSNLNNPLPFKNYTTSRVHNQIQAPVTPELDY